MSPEVFRAAGGENVFLYILQRALKLRVTNPCLTLQAVHLHCELPTTFGARMVGDQRLGKKLVATVARYVAVARPSTL